MLSKLDVKLQKSSMEESVFNNVKLRQTAIIKWEVIPVLVNNADNVNDNDIQIFVNMLKRVNDDDYIFSIMSLITTGYDKLNTKLMNNNKYNSLYIETRDKLAYSFRLV